MNKYTIAIVDDSPTMRMILSKIISDNYSAKLEVYEYENGKKFLDSTSSSIPNIVILDWNMPDIDGYETMKRFRELKVSQSAIVIMISNESKLEDIKKIASEGLNGYMLKPIDESKFTAMMDKILEHVK